MEKNLYNLTNPQKSIWLMDQVNPGTNLNNIGGPVLINDSVNVPLLEKALNLYIEKNEATRLRIKLVDSSPMQYVADYSYFTIPVTKLKNEKELEDWNQKIIDTPFNVFDSNLYSLSIFVLPDGRGGFNATLHHLITDAWSMSLLITEVMSNYSNLIHNNSVDYVFPNYTDFIDAENNYINSEKFPKDRLFWDEYFENCPELCSISSNNINSNMIAKRKSYILNSDLFAKINDFCKLLNCSVYTFFMSIYSIYLSKLTNISEPIIGTPVLNRTNFKEKHTSGMFISTVPFKAKVDSNITFSEFVKSVAITQLAIFRHQKYPYSHLLEDLKKKYNFSENLYDIALSYQNARDNKENCDIDYSSGWLFSGKCTDTLQVHFYDMDNTGDLNIFYDYQLDKLSDEEINTLHERIMNIVNQVLLNNEIEIKNIEIVTENEKEFFISQFNNNILDYSKEKSIIELFDEQVKLHPNAIAVSDDKNSISYIELQKRINSLSYELQKQGVKKGDVVSTFLKRSPELIISLLAIMKIGGIYLPISTSLPEERVEYILNDSNSRCCITASNCSYLKNVIFIDKINNQNSQLTPVTYLPDDVIYTIYTSGSTGNPKGVQVTNKNLNNFVCSFNKYFDHKVSTQDICLASTNISFDVSIWEIFFTLLNGAQLYLYDEDNISDIFHYCDVILKHNVTMLYIPPNILENVYSILHESNNVKIDKILVGVEPIKNSTIQKFFSLNENMQIVNGYGPTETTICCTAFKVAKKEANDNSIIPIGKPLYNLTAYVLNKDLNIVPEGIAGELFIGGDNVTKGYLNNETLTNEKYIQSPFKADERLYRTGDLVKFLPDGNLLFVGRDDKQVKVRGHRIEINEIENTISMYPNIQKCIINLRNNNQVIVAFIVASTNISTKDLKQFLLTKLPAYSVPNFIIQLDSFPTTANGKIDKKQLNNIEINFSMNYVAPQNELQQQLVDIWSEILQVNNIGIEDSFFEIGGDSLSSIRLVSEIYNKFGIKLTVNNIFENDTIEDLAVYMQAQNASLVENIEKAKISDSYPLTSAQKGIYYAVSLEENPSITYNTPGGIFLTGNLNIKKLEDCINTLIKKHVALRTYFTMQNNELVQKIDDNINFSLKIENGNINDVDTIFAKFVQPFDLSKAPLFRIKLIEFDKTHYLLLVDFHHIICDGTSIGIFTAELVNLYNGNSIKENNFDYIDYAIFENKLKSSEKYNQMKQFWKSKFDGELPVLNMPTNFARPANRSFEGDEVLLNITNADEIYTLCKSLHTTLYFFLLSVYYILLSKYTSQEDIIVGTAVAGRDDANFANILGMFVNTLALREKIDSNLSFNEFLNIVTQTGLACLENQTYPFDELVKELNLNRNTNRAPLFDTMFVYQNEESALIDFSGVETKLYTPCSKVSKFDFSLDLTPKSNVISARLEYATSLFTKDFMTQFLNHYISLIKLILNDIHVTIKEISLLNKDEKLEIEKTYNSSILPYDENVKLVELFENEAEKNPNNIAIRFNGSSITYEELNKKANQIANFLISKNVKRNQIVGILLPRTPDLLFAMLGILKSGAGYMLIDTSLPYDRISFMLENAHSNYLITNKDSKNIDGVEKLYLDELPLENYSAQNVNAYSDNEDSFAVIYTSGSTGTPKGVELKRKGVINMLSNYKAFLYTDTCTNFLSMSSVAFDMFIVENFVPLLSGKTVILTNEEEQKIPLYTNTLIEQEHVNFILTTPSRMDLLLSVGSNWNTIKVIQLGGEVFPSNLYDKIKAQTSNAHIFNGYGPSEITACCTSKEVYNSNDITIGKPFANTQLWICNKDLNICPIGVEGEICVAGLGVGKGYINNPDLTNKSFVPNPFGDGIMYKTGDIGKYKSNGDIEFIGRRDSQIKIRGLRVELSEIENQFLKIPEITNICIIYKKETVPYLAAFFTSSGEIETSVIRKQLSETLPLYMVPKYIIKLDKLPITLNGKIDKKQLENYSISQVETRTYVAPRNETEKLCCNIWESLLNCQIGIDDDIFEMGADSLLAIKFKTELLAYNINITYSDIFKYHTVRELVSTHGEYDIELLDNKDFVECHNALEKNVASNFATSLSNLQSSSYNNILLLGANGFVGSHILYSFIKNDTGNAYCIVRDKDRKEGKTRFLETLHFYFGNELDHYLNNRIFVINSSILDENFGMSEKDYLELLNSIDVIINSAAIVKHYGNEEKFKKINVGLTEKLIDICTKFNKRLLHVSSLSVSGNLSLDGSYADRIHEVTENMNFSEHNLYIGQILDNEYIKSKFLSEKLILENISKNGLQAQILRLGNITNRYSDGAFQINYQENAFLERMLTFIELGYVPNNLLDMYIEFTPVDVCGNAIIKILQNYVPDFSVYHLYNDNHVYMNEFLKILQEENINIVSVSPEEFGKKITDLSKNAKSANILSGIINDLGPDKQLEYKSNINILSDFTKAFLYHINFKWPKIDESYLKKYINYLRKYLA